MIKSVMLHESFVWLMPVFVWHNLNDTVFYKLFYKSTCGVDEILNCAHSSVVHTNSSLCCDRTRVVFNFKKSEIKIMELHKIMIKSVMLHERFV